MPVNELSEPAPSVQAAAREAAARDPNLKRYLDRFLAGFAFDDHLSNDPVQFVRAYPEREDREVAGFIASAFAYGNVRMVVRSVDRILKALGPHPARFARSFEPESGKRLVRGFCHRWNTSRDVDVLVWILGRLLEAYGSLENAALDVDGDVECEPGPERQARRLDRFSRRALGFEYQPFYPASDLARRLGVRYFFPSPADRSACKRLNLFLRWMVRADDGVDCGVWTRIEPSELIMPVDTHIARISRYIGLTHMTTPGWAMAADITRSLSRIDPADPLRYDFALCHMGIAGNCPQQRDLVKCAGCPIQAVCLL